MRAGRADCSPRARRAVLRLGQIGTACTLTRRTTNSQPVNVLDRLGPVGLAATRETIPNITVLCLNAAAIRFPITPAKHAAFAGSGRRLTTATCASPSSRGRGTRTSSQF